MNLFFNWLATSPLATALKVAVAASLSWVLDNQESLNVPPVALVAFVAAIPVLINWLNPEDYRYGINSIASLIKKDK
jgi:hypothetical protein